MLRRLRKKLELIEIWGWCPPKPRYLPYIDIRDSWKFLGSEHLKMIQIIAFSNIWFSGLPQPILMIFGAFWSPVVALSLVGLFPQRSYVDFRRSDVDLWIFLRILNFKWFFLWTFWMDLNDFWCILKLCYHSFTFGSFSQRSCMDFQRSDVYLWIFLKIMNFTIYRARRKCNLKFIIVLFVYNIQRSTSESRKST